MFPRCARSTTDGKWLVATSGNIRPRLLRRRARYNSVFYWDLASKLGRETAARLTMRCAGNEKLEMPASRRFVRTDRHVFRQTKPITHVPRVGRVEKRPLGHGLFMKYLKYSAPRSFALLRLAKLDFDSVLSTTDG